MGSIRVREQTGNLFFDFRFKGSRCREQTALTDTKENRRKLEKILRKIEAEITLGSFDYGAYFPNSPRAEKFAPNESQTRQLQPTKTPLFSSFCETWFREMQIQWRPGHISKVRGTLDKYLIPEFGGKEVSCITKSEVLEFRSQLAKVKKRNGKTLSPSRINHIMTPLRMILGEAADRFDFITPYRGIKSLKVPRTDVEPFSLEEVELILKRVREDFRPYFTVRFFTGMRTSEIDGLQWKYIDFERSEILVRRALVRGNLQDLKTDGSYRTIAMSTPVINALQKQQRVSCNEGFVFCSSNGTPLMHNNVTKRVWYPLLNNLGLRKRRPYQTRHTAATLWLAAGENPEWIASQLGHATTEMLFRIYSRYVPNLTRRDGSAFESLVSAKTQLV